jgi:hypothetical protein
MADLPYIDEYMQSIDASPERAWAALLRVLGSNRVGTATLAWVLRCDPADRTLAFGSAVGETVPGFRISAIEPGKRLSLEGCHRFSRYRLTFELAGDRVFARTHAAFPNILGQIYKAAVIGSGTHRLVTRRLLRQVADAARQVEAGA